MVNDETYYYEPVDFERTLLQHLKKPVAHHVASKLRLDVDQFYYEFIYPDATGQYWSIAVVADSQQEAEDFLLTECYTQGAGESLVPQLIFQRIATFDDIAVRKI